MAHTVNRSPATLGATLKRGSAAAPQNEMPYGEKLQSPLGGMQPETQGVREESQAVSVVLADSDVSRLKSYESHLRKAGFSVSTADGGVACIRRIRESAPDILVLDPKLLWGGGDGILALMRDDPDTPIVPTFVQGCGHGSCQETCAAFPVLQRELRYLPPRQLAMRLREIAGSSPRSGASTETFPDGMDGQPPEVPIERTKPR